MPLLATRQAATRGLCSVEVPVPAARVNPSRTVGQRLSHGQKNLTSLRSFMVGTARCAVRRRMSRVADAAARRPYQLRTHPENVTLAAPRMSQNYKDTLNLPK